MKFIVSEFLSYENNKDNNCSINCQSNICFIISVVFVIINQQLISHVICWIVKKIWYKFEDILEKKIEFIETYDINQITNCTWKQLCERLREEIAQQNSNVYNDFILFANLRKETKYPFVFLIQ